MTDAQKEQVRAMRMQGIGYRLIAKSLGLKINQVQLFCKSHGPAGNGELVKLHSLRKKTETAGARQTEAVL